MKNYLDQISKYIEDEKKVLGNLPAEDINQVMNLLEKARLEGRRIYICGNGGSASTASHFVGDFNKGVSFEKVIKYNFESLTDNVPMITAIANDIGYEDVFVIPLKNKLQEGDIVIGISGSGNSENVVRAIQYANDMNADTVAIVGYDGGKLKQMAKYNLHVAVNNMQIVEDVHIVLNHMMMYILSQ